MARSKKLIILLVALLVMGAATIAAIHGEERREEIRTSEQILFETPSDSVDALSWTYEGNTLAFHKDGAWQYDEDAAFPVSKEKITSLLKQFEAFGVSFVIEHVEDYAQYGLDDSICTIRLSAGDQSYQLQLGDFSSMDAKRYVSIGDGNVYLVKKDPLEEFDATLKDLIDNDETPRPEHAERIQFEGAEAYEIRYEEDSPDAYSDEDVYFTQHNGANRPLDASLVSGYLQTLGGLSLTEYVSYNATEEEIKDCGLDAPDLSITLNYKDEDNAENTFTLHISRDPAETAEDDVAKAYARAGDSPILYEIPAETYNELMRCAYDDLRHLSVFWSDFSTVTQVDVTLEGSDYTLTTEGEGDSRKYLYQGEETSISAFQSALEALGATGFTSEAPAQQEEIRLTLHTEDENHPQREIALYRYDGTRCLAVVDGETEFFVERAAAVDLIEVVHAIVLAQDMEQ